MNTTDLICSIGASLSSIEKNIDNPEKLNQRLNNLKKTIESYQESVKVQPKKPPQIEIYSAETVDIWKTSCDDNEISCEALGREYIFDLLKLYENIDTFTHESHLTKKLPNALIVVFYSNGHGNKNPNFIVIDEDGEKYCLDLKESKYCNLPKDGYYYLMDKANYKFTKGNGKNPCKLKP